MGVAKCSALRVNTLLKARAARLKSNLTDYSYPGEPVVISRYDYRL